MRLCDLVRRRDNLFVKLQRLRRRLSQLDNKIIRVKAARVKRGQRRQAYRANHPNYPRRVYP